MTQAAVSPVLSPAFARVLADGRADFNRRALEARRRHQGFDTEAFAAFLTREVDGVVSALAGVPGATPAQVREAAFAAYDIALALTGLRLVGPRARSQAVTAAWREALPRCAHLLVADPGQVIGTVCNAVVHLDGIAGVRSAQWIAELARLAPRVASPAELRALGQVLAWRVGAAHFRAGALAAAATLPQPLALAALGEPGAGSWTALRSRIEADLWWRAAADGPLASHIEVGAFTGFGGLFGAPAQVRSSGPQFFLRAGERHFLLLADAYGSSLLAADAADYEEAEHHTQTPRFQVDNGVLAVDGRRIALDLPAEGLRLCATEDTLAISSPYTHAVRLVPRR